MFEKSFKRVFKMFFTSKLSSLSVLFCFALLVSDSIVIGKPNAFSQKTLKQLILSGLKKGPNPCDNVENDIARKCPESSFGDSCSGLQKQVNCIVGVVKTDCGDYMANTECDNILFILHLYGNPCQTECSA